jgi:hypothetical protein
MKLTNIQCKILKEKLREPIEEERLGHTTFE